MSTLMSPSGQKQVCCKLSVLRPCRSDSVRSNAAPRRNNIPNPPRELPDATHNRTDRTAPAGSGKPPTTAAATAVDTDSTTTVIDSIPWGSGGTATTRGRTVPTQTAGSGGGGGSTGGSTGGGGGPSDKSTGDSSSDDGGNDRMPGWWVRALLAGGVGVVALMNSSVREAIQSAVQSVKARFYPGRLYKNQAGFQTLFHHP